MTIEELADYVLEVVKQEILGGLRMYPKRFGYTWFVLRLSDEPDINQLRIINEAYEGIVKEFISYIK